MMTSTVRNTREAQHTAMTITSPDHQLSSAGHEVALGAERGRSSLSVPWMCGSTLFSSLGTFRASSRLQRTLLPLASCKDEVLHSGGSRKLKNSQSPTQDQSGTDTQIPRLLKKKSPSGQHRSPHHTSRALRLTAGSLPSHITAV